MADEDGTVMASEDNKKDFELIPMTPEILKTIDQRDLTRDDYPTLVAMGIEVAEAKTYSQWMLGKLAAALLEYQHGDLMRYAKDIAQPYDSLRRYASVYKRFTEADPDFHPSRYAGSVPWAVLDMVSRVSIEDPVALVNELHDDSNMTIESAYRAIKKKETGKDVPPKPRIKLAWDEPTEKYLLEMDENDFGLINWSRIGQQLRSYLETLR